MLVTFTIPYPPSVNHLYGRSKWGGEYIKPEGKQFYALTAMLISKHSNAFPSQRLSVTIKMHPPDKRKRDLDNVLKAILDSVTKANVWTDDNQIDRLLIERAEVIKHGSIILKIEAIQTN
jgi:crossover junction endodeoxyribonuclease RusA